MNPFDIIILAGQSNAEGSGLGEVEKIYQPNERIWALCAERELSEVNGAIQVQYKNLPFSLEWAKEAFRDGAIRGNFALTFAEEYVRQYLSTERNVLIVSAAIGGTGFQKGHWGMSDAVYLKMLEMVDYALSLHKENRLVAMLWHQGEHEAVEGNSPSNYEKQLNDLFLSVRERYALPKLPIIAGDFCPDWKYKNAEIACPIAQTVQSVVSQISYSAFVETENLRSNNQVSGNGDDIHFCRADLVALGRKYFVAFQEIKRWECIEEKNKSWGQ